MSDFKPDMTFSWASPQMVSPSQPQNRTLPTWGAVGSPDAPKAAFAPSTPLGMARKAVGYAGLGGFGSATDDVLAWRRANPGLATMVTVAVLADIAALGYHGYKRNGNNTGWGVAWGLGGFFGLWWLLTPIALVQGFAKPKKR